MENKIIKQDDKYNKGIELIRKTIASDCNEEEFSLFMEVAKRTGLDPFMKQIYPIARMVSVKDDSGNWSKEKKITHQTSIDGFRVIADRTGQYAGSTAPIYSQKLIQGKYPEFAKVAIKKIIGDKIFEIEAVAFWEEFKQDFKGKLGSMWEKMPRHMLAKCAEALALRKAFPAQLSGVYTNDEMSQADNSTNDSNLKKVVIEKATTDQLTVIDDLIKEHKISKETQNKWLEKVGVNTFGDAPRESVQKFIDYYNQLPKSSEVAKHG